MTIRDDQIQAAFLAHIKGRTNITNEVAAAQIKEEQPQLTDFTYPGIRVRVGPNVPVEGDCPQGITIRIIVYSEDASSQQCMRIAGIIQNEYHERSFQSTGLSQNVMFTGLVATTVPVIRQDRTTWRSEVILAGVVSSG